MAYLPLANILHYKLRSALSALGIGIGICMLITLSGLARGSLDEIADRWEAVDADLIAYPDVWGENLATISGVGLPDGIGRKILADHGDLIRRVVPVFLWPVKLAGQDQTAVGVDPGQFHTLVGERKIAAGRCFDPGEKFSAWLEEELLAPAADGDDRPVEITAADLGAGEHNGLELVIDTRLARAGDFKLNDIVEVANHPFRIVGIIPAGGMARVFMPRRTAQFLFNCGDITKSTLFFIKLQPGAETTSAARKIRTLGVEVIQPDRYRDMLQRKFGIMFVYVDAVNAVALIIAFLFIMITLYTMVLQRTRDVAILKSSGASNAFILRQVLGESVLLTGAGALAGIALSFPAAWAIEKVQPLLTVTISWRWIAVGVVAAAVGALLSALYPAWRATRVDVLEALRLE